MFALLVFSIKVTKEHYMKCGFNCFNKLKKKEKLTSIYEGEEEAAKAQMGF